MSPHYYHSVRTYWRRVDAERQARSWDRPRARLRVAHLLHCHSVSFFPLAALITVQLSSFFLLLLRLRKIKADEETTH